MSHVSKSGMNCLEDAQPSSGVLAPYAHHLEAVKQRSERGLPLSPADHSLLFLEAAVVRDARFLENRARINLAGRTGPPAALFTTN
jgi:hypothetical protein